MSFISVVLFVRMVISNAMRVSSRRSPHVLVHKLLHVPFQPLNIRLELEQGNIIKKYYIKANNYTENLLIQTARIKRHHLVVGLISEC